MWPYPRVVAHRGGGSLAPENTLSAMKKAAALGFKGVEFDVKLARDGTPFLLHDDTLDRTSNGSGEANQLSYSELLRLDAGSWFASEFAGEPIPRFDTVARFLVEHGIWANIEIKPAHGCEEITGKAVALAARELWRDAAVPPLLSSFSAVSLRAARDAAPELPRGYIVREVPEDWSATMRELKCVSMHCSWKRTAPALVPVIKAAGHGLVMWTVNDVDTARRFLEMGVDTLITDRLELIGPDFA